MLHANAGQVKIYSFYNFKKSNCIICHFYSLLRMAHHLSKNRYQPLLSALPCPSFFIYHKTLQVHISQSLSIFCSICTLMGFPGNFAYGFDAWLHPTQRSAEFSPEAALFQFALSCVIAALVAYPLFHFEAFLIKNLEFYNVWYIKATMSLIFLALNLTFIPHQYQTLYVNNVFPVFLITISGMLFLFLTTEIIFYLISVQILSNAQDKERIRFFEMQEAQYLAQKRYITQTEKLRHDFRQSLRILKELAGCGDWDAIKEYLNQYMDMLPNKEVTAYCPNLAVNALLNYYASIEEQSQIRKKWAIRLPEDCLIPEPDFCSLLGNILENAVNGCTTAEEGKRYHYLSVCLKNECSVYIVSINGFQGELQKKDGRYLSAKPDGVGIGISSIEMTAKKYGGIAKISHTKDEFTVDVMMQPPCKEKSGMVR